MKGASMSDPVFIVAETGSDVPDEYLEKYNIRLVPMHVIFGQTDKPDGSFDPEEIIEYFRRTGEVPKTSGAVEEDFNAVFDRIHEEHPGSGILYLAYSAVTTCSYGCASMAAEGRPYVRLLDTKQCSGGQCAIVMKVAEMLLEHPEWDLDRAAEEAEKVIEQTRFFFLPTNLRFLQAGGRLSNAAAVFGIMLKIVPFVEIRTGLLIADKKYRGRLSSVVSKAIQDFSEKYIFKKSLVWLIATPGFPEEIRRIAHAAASSLGFKEIRWLNTKGVITTHAGPSAFGMAAYEE